MSAEQIFHGVCKQVNHGDSIVVRERQANGPPATTNLGLMNVICAKMAFSKSKTSDIVYDELFAHEAREFVRNLIVGKDICYTKTKMPKGGSIGEVWVGKLPTGESINLQLVREGLAEVRKVNNPEALGKNSNYAAFIEAEEAAKAAKKGKWDPDTTVQPRGVINFLPDAQKFLDENKDKNLKGVVEYVRDGANMQVCIMPEKNASEQVHNVVMVSLAGIRCPGFKNEGGELTPEKFAPEAKIFVESRLLQRTIDIKLFSVNNNQSFIGSLIHPNGDIAVFLLKNGLGKVIEWSLKYIWDKSEYIQAEMEGKSKKVGLWVDFVPPPGPSQEEINLMKQKTASSGKLFSGTISEVGLIDNLTVLCSDNVYRKFFLSSLRIPRPGAGGPPAEGAEKPAAPVGGKRTLYDSHVIFGGREYLRKFVGKKVHVYVDYTLPKPEGSNLDDRICTTVIVSEGAVNLAEGLVSRGFATVVKHRANDPRAKFYEKLQSAEEEAMKKTLGFHSKEPSPIIRVNDVTGNPKKSKQFLPLFQRQGRFNAIVEYLPSASRLRLYCPKECMIINVVCAGIICARNDRRLPDSKVEKGDPFGEEAYRFAKEHLLQRNVEVEVEAVDKTGSFIGYIHMGNTFTSNGMLSKQQVGKLKSVANNQMISSNILNTVLILNGFATVSRTAASAGSSHYHTLERAEAEAKRYKKGVWSLPEFVASMETDTSFGNETEEPEVAQPKAHGGKFSSEELAESFTKLSTQKSATSKKINLLLIATDSNMGSDGVRVCCQLADDAMKLSMITSELSTNPPIASLCQTFKPTKGAMCAAKYSQDNCWYRAMVTNVLGNKVNILFVDYGNDEVVEANSGSIGPLSDKIKSIPPLAKWIRLAGVKLCDDHDVRVELANYLHEKLSQAETYMDVESQNPVPTNSNDKKPLSTYYIRVNAGKQAGGSSSGKMGLVDLAEDLIENGFVYVDQTRQAIPMPIRYQYEKLQNEAISQRKRIWKYGDCRPSD